MKSTLGMVLALLTLLELTFSSQVVFAANDITRLVPFQGRLHGGNNKIVSDGTYDLTFYIYETPTGGTSLWTETHPSVSVIHGYVNVLLGAISPMVESNYATQAPLYGEGKNTVNFAQQKYLGISINGGAEMFPRSQLVPTFHAYTANHATHATQADNAENANTLDGKDSTYFAAAAGSNSRLATLEGKFTSAKAKDADKLDGLNSTDFLRNTAKAVDADKVDGLDSTNFMRSTSANGYPGITLPGGSTAGWFRTTTNGLLPYQQGGASSIGTSSWNFTNIYGSNIYDGNTLLENKYLGKTAKAADANKLDGLDNTYFRNASNLNAGTISTARLPAASTTVRGATKKNQMSNAQNGYFWDKETGFMMQWGIVYSNTTGDMIVNYPTAFTTAHNVTTNIVTNQGWNGDSEIYVHSIRSNNFIANRSNNSGLNMHFYWQATGYRAP
ncbi:MAG: hypothetical protein ACI910_001210 [Oleispira sp.]|jgi:hypothetical protein